MKRYIGALALVLALAAVSIAVAGCGADSPAQACAQGPLFASARQRAERAVSELETTTTLELEEALLSMSDRIAVLREVSPRSLRDSLGTLLAAYGQLIVAFDQVGWDPKVGATDADVAKARASFTDESVAVALGAVEDFLAEQCELARSGLNPNFAVTASTLPLPDISQEASADADEDLLVSASELQAFGFSIAESYGIAVSTTEAECLGRSLNASFAGGSDAQYDDVEYFALVVSAFTTCAVGTSPTTIVGATPGN